MVLSRPLHVFTVLVLTVMAASAANHGRSQGFQLGGVETSLHKATASMVDRVGRTEENFSLHFCFLPLPLSLEHSEEESVAILSCNEGLGLKIWPSSQGGRAEILTKDFVITFPLKYDEWTETCITGIFSGLEATIMVNGRHCHEVNIDPNNKNRDENPGATGCVIGQRDTKWGAIGWVADLHVWTGILSPSSVRMAFKSKERSPQCGHNCHQLLSMDDFRSSIENTHLIDTTVWEQVNSRTESRYSLVFDLGSTMVVPAVSQEIIDEMTVELWFKSVEVDHGGALFSSIDILEPALMHIQMEPNGVSIFSESSSMNLEGISSKPINVWRHVAVSAGKMLTVIENGVRTRSLPFGSRLRNTKQSYYTVGNGYDLGRPFRGAIAEVRVWMVERTPELIQANMFVVSSGISRDGLYGYWPMNEKEGSVVSDHSGLERHAATYSSLRNETWIPCQNSPIRELTPTSSAIQIPNNPDRDMVVYIRHDVCGYTPWLNEHRKLESRLKCKRGCIVSYNAHHVGLADIVAMEASVLANTHHILYPKTPGQLWSTHLFENTFTDPGFVTSDDYLDLFQIRASFMDWANLPISLVCPDLDLFSEGASIDDFLKPHPNKTEEHLAAYIVSNCHNSNGTYRHEYVGELMEHIHVDSYGKCHHNAEPTKEMEDFASMKDWGIGTAIKFAIFRTYKFALVFENKIFPNYVTEKIWHAYYSGAVPVYWGTESVRNIVPSEDSYIDASKYTPQELAEYLLFLNENNEEYEKFFLWKLRRPLRQEFVDAYNVCVYRHSTFCRFCDMVAEKREEEIGKLGAQVGLIPDPGYGMNFQSSQDYLAFPSSINDIIAKSFTFSLWMKPQTFFPHERALMKTLLTWEDGSHKHPFVVGLSERRSSGKLVACICGQCMRGRGTMLTGFWHHITVTVSRDEGTIKMYVDGYEEGSMIRNLTDCPVGTRLLFGKREHGDHGARVDVTIDSLALFSRALLRTEIVRHVMWTRLYAGIANLEGYWPFDGHDATIVDDVSGNHRHIMVNGSPKRVRVGGLSVYEGKHAKDRQHNGAHYNCTEGFPNPDWID